MRVWTRELQFFEFLTCCRHLNKDDFVFFFPYSINSINHRLDYQKYNVSLFLHSMSVYIGRYNITTDDAPRSFTAADNDE